MKDIQNEINPRESTPDNIGWIYTEEKGWLWYFKDKINTKRNDNK